MRARIEKEIQPVEEMGPPKILKVKRRRRKKTQVDEEMIALENLAFDNEMDDYFKQYSKMKIKVFR